MEPLTLKPRQPVEADVENWDDDDFDFADDGLTFQSTAANHISNVAPTRRRDSNSSRLSFRSDFDSNHGDDDQLFHLPEDDESSTSDALRAAQNAGIPLPKNVAPSALTGGTIRRLGGRKIRKIIQEEDWENDLTLPDSSQALQLKTQHNVEFPETLRQVSAGSSLSSPTKLTEPQHVPVTAQKIESTQNTTSALSAAINLDKFKDNEDDDDVFGPSNGTIKAPKEKQTPQPVSFITPPTPQKKDKSMGPEEDFEQDLELPSDGNLKLSTNKDIPRTPTSLVDDLDWGEGSLGTRYGGTRRDGRSNRSSSASALSPSVSSSFTIESEDETFDGLVLPSGHVNFEERLQQRRTSRSPHRSNDEVHEPAQKENAPPAEADRADFLDGLEIGDGNVFNSGKLTLHRNVKMKEVQPASPARPKTAVSLTFTNKPTGTTRIPRLSHERAHSTSLEPVSESGGPIPQRNRRSQSRLGHMQQHSLSSLPTSSTSSANQVGSQFTPRRREVGGKPSLSSLKNEPTTTSAQLLKQKRSLPAIKALNSPAKLTFRSDRPSSRTDTSRPQLGGRPKTPVDRCIAESPAVTTGRKPFLPAGASQSQSQHVASKTLRHFRRHDSDNSIDLRPTSRALSRATLRSPSPHRYRVNADTWERLSKPKIKKHFGDGHELDGFDDLPTSKESENRYLRQPMSSGPKASLRNKVYQNVLPERGSTPSPSTPPPPSATRTTGLPHFARDTAASRRARETSLAHRGPTSGPLAPVTAQRTANFSIRNNVNVHPQLPQSTVRSKKHMKRPSQSKPHLISNLNTDKESKTVNGMFYNPETFRWEGNENALSAFDATVSTPTQPTAPAHLREKETTTPRPALITNISSTKGVQVVGGMVFDPQNMCWLKLGPPTNNKSETSDPLDGRTSVDDEDDPFKDIPDLDDTAGDDSKSRTGPRVSDIQDDWLVGEEFDVGPEFVRRQREEEERWRKKCDKWVSRGPRDREAWRWTIRELVSQFDELPM